MLNRTELLIKYLVNVELNQGNHSTRVQTLNSKWVGAGVLFEVAMPQSECAQGIQDSQNDHTACSATVASLECGMCKGF